MIQGLFKRLEAWEKEHLNQDLSIPKLDFKEKILYQLLLEEWVSTTGKVSKAI